MSSKIGENLKFVKIKVHDGGSYIQPFSELGQAINDEFDDFFPGKKITLEIVDMTQEEYDNLPEFTGH